MGVHRFTIEIMQHKAIVLFNKTIGTTVNGFQQRTFTGAVWPDNDVQSRSETDRLFYVNSCPVPET